MGRNKQTVQSILITNLHSAQNLGDEAINRVTLEFIAQAFPNAEVTLAANHPQSWQKVTKGQILYSMSTWAGNAESGDWKSRSWKLPVYMLFLAVAALFYRCLGWKFCIGTSQQRALQKSYYKADLVLSCGGGNFYANSALSPAYFWALLTVAFASALGKPVLMLPQSIGPIAGRLQRFFARLTFNQMDRILLREQRSFDFARQELRLRAPLALVPDLAFGLSRIPQSVATDARPVLHIGITPMDRQAQDKRFQRQAEYEEILVKVLQKLHQEYTIRCSIIAQSSGPSRDQDDRLVARRLYEKLLPLVPEVELCDSFDHLNDLLTHFSQLDCLIGTRMHTAILGFTQSVPTVLIAYQHKAQGMMAMMEMADYCVDIHQIELNALYTKVKQLVDQRTLLRQQIRLKVIQFQRELQQIPEQLQQAVLK